MGIKIISDNKKARHDYHLLEKFEAGLALTGSEVKSIKNGQVNLKDSYISFRGHEAYLQNAHVSVYAASSYNNHDPERLRKLLLHKKELADISRSVHEKGLTCVPTKIYLKKGIIKLEIALAKGKQMADKRESVKKRDADRAMKTALKRSRG